MVRQLKHHEQRLLKKTDFLAWKQDANLREVRLLLEGLACPTGDPILECSGHGACNCTTGACVCSGPCWGGGDCNVFNTGGPCGSGGTCQSADVGCVCSDPCFVLSADGSMCVPRDCGAGGTCSGGTCVCADACTTLGPDGTCSQKFDCGFGTCTASPSPTCSCDSCHSLDGGGKCTLPKDCGAFSSAGCVSGPGVMLRYFDEQGGDRSTNYLNPGQGASDCRAQCLSEPTCKAWTFAAVG